MAFVLPDPTPRYCKLCGGQLEQHGMFGYALVTFHTETGEFLCPEPEDQKEKK
jgi:hypothetical protein